MSTRSCHFRIDIPGVGISPKVTTIATLGLQSLALPRDILPNTDFHSPPTQVDSEGPHQLYRSGVAGCQGGSVPQFRVASCGPASFLSQAFMMAENMGLVLMKPTAPLLFWSCISLHPPKADLPTPTNVHFSLQFPMRSSHHAKLEAQIGSTFPCKPQKH